MSLPPPIVLSEHGVEHPLFQAAWKRYVDQDDHAPTNQQPEEKTSKSQLGEASPYNEPKARKRSKDDAEEGCPAKLPTNQKRVVLPQRPTMRATARDFLLGRDKEARRRKRRSGKRRRINGVNQFSKASSSSTDDSSRHSGLFGGKVETRRSSAAVKLLSQEEENANADKEEEEEEKENEMVKAGKRRRMRMKMVRMTKYMIFRLSKSTRGSKVFTTSRGPTGLLRLIKIKTNLTKCNKILANRENECSKGSS